MQINVKRNRTEYSELTPEEFEAGMAFFASWSGPLSYGDHEGENDWLSLNNPTPELTVAFEAALNAA